MEQPDGQSGSDCDEEVDDAAQKGPRRLAGHPCIVVGYRG